MEKGFLDKFLRNEQEFTVENNEIKSSETTNEPGTPPQKQKTRNYALPLSEETRKYMQDSVTDRMREIYDPEIPVDIYELGLIYEINVAEDGKVEIIMTLTTPHCPVAETMPGEVQIRAQDVEGVRDVNVELVWDPPWTIYMMSEAARLEMGFM